MKKRFALYGMFAAMAIFATACGDDSSSGPEEESSSSIEAEDESSSSVEEEGKSSAKEEGKSSAADKKSSSSEAKKGDSSSSEKTTSSSSAAVSSSSHYSTEPTCTTKTEGDVVSSELTYYATEVGDVRVAMTADFENKTATLTSQGTLFFFESCEDLKDSYAGAPFSYDLKSCSDTEKYYDLFFDYGDNMGMIFGTIDKAGSLMCEELEYPLDIQTDYLNHDMLDRGEYGTFRDTRDAMLYRTIKIGDQTWMAQNLNYESKSGSSCYEGDIGNCYDYGRLYTWDVAKSACPDGWRLPTKADFVELVANVEPGFNETSGEFGNGFKLMSKKESEGTDEIGFSAVLGGTYYGEYDYRKSQAYFWSQTAAEEGAYTLVISGYENNAIYDAATGDRRRSVRCIKDDAPSQSVSSN